MTQVLPGMIHQSKSGPGGVVLNVASVQGVQSQKVLGMKLFDFTLID